MCGSVSVRIAVAGLLAGLLVSGLVGCGAPLEGEIVNPELQKASTSEPAYGLLWMFPGLIGEAGELDDAYRGLREAGLLKEVHIFDWDRPLPDFSTHLFDYGANRRQAAYVADRIVAYRAKYPDKPIDLVGYSAGAALAVWVAEELPDGFKLNNVVLCQAALSPTYDLTRALEHIDGKLIAMYSERDVFLGGWFCTVWGTMDRILVPAAAQIGFLLEVAVPDAELRERVEQVGWNEEWEAAGHSGLHMPILQYRWNRYIVAPYLLSEEEVAAGAEE